MDFDFNDEQREIKSTARDFLASRFSRRRSASWPSPRARTTTAIWNEICELGWPGIAISEEYGGQGLGVVELVILQEELGYVCAPVPFLANAYAGAVIEAAGSDEQKQRWLPGIASGAGRGRGRARPRRRGDRRRRRAAASSSRWPRARARSWSRPPTRPSSDST